MIHKGEDIQCQVLANYRGYHQFYWTRLWRMWFHPRCPVHMEFCEEVLYQLVDYDDTLRLCVRLVAKRKLI